MTDEKQVLTLIATDRLDIPISSIEHKLRRSRTSLAGEVAEVIGNKDYDGDRFYARVVVEDREKARGMRAAVDEFKTQYPTEGRVLEGMIREKRVISERHLEFGMQPNKRLNADDYMNVMQSLGFSEATSRAMYPDLMQVSYSMQKKRDYEQRSVILGGTESESD